MGLTKKQRFMVVVIVVGTFVTVLNQTLVTPALPSIMDEMAVDETTGQWLTTGFTLVNAIMIPITAYLQDRFSTKRLFLFSMVLFAIGTLLCAWGPNFATLLGGRLVQAGGAGILMPLGMTVLLTTFPVDKRGMAMGIFGLVVAFAPAIGPTAAGFAIDLANWHIMFYVVAALCGVVIALAAALMEKGAPQNKGDSRLEPLSVVLSTLGFGCLLYSFSIFGSVGLAPITLITFAVGVGGVVWFFLRQLHLEVPMLRVRVLMNRTFLVATIIGMLVQASLLAAGILMPIYIQNLLDQPATISGLVLMPGALVMGVMNPIAGKLFDKHGPRKLAIAGMGLLLISTVAFGLLTLETSVIFVTLVFVVRMLAMALVNMPVTTWGMNALDTRYLNHGTSVNNTLRQVAGSLGTAMVISISAWVRNAAGAAGVPAANSQMYGIDAAFMVCAALVAAGLVLTLVFVKSKPGQTDAVGTEGTKSAKGDAAANKSLLESIMKTDVFTLPVTATVGNAMRLFTSKGISACPIVDDQGEPVGFISDGDILKRLARTQGTYTDPIALIATTAQDDTPYDKKLEHVMALPVTSVGVKDPICVNVHANIEEVCRVLAGNHLKKVPVLDRGHIVGVINRSDITRYSMEAYLEGRPENAVFCEPVDGTDASDAACELPHRPHNTTNA